MIYLYTSDACFLAFLLAWQAHYDLKDPAGLAGFLIDSDIKLVRAESGSSDGSSRHKSHGDMKGHGMQNEEKTKFATDVAFFIRCVVLFFHSSSRHGMEQCRTSLLGLI